MLLNFTFWVIGLVAGIIFQVTLGPKISSEIGKDTAKLQAIEKILKGE
jgi:hypothetical protein